MKKELSVVTSRVTGKKDVVDQMAERLHEHRRKWGNEPKGFVLGPHEYVGYMAKAKEMYKYTSLKDIIYPETFMGLPVSAKTTSGIDLTIDPKRVFDFCLHDMDLSNQHTASGNEGGADE
jgi:hypothetical protein